MWTETVKTRFEATRHNNFNAIRLLLSVAVLLSHCYPLALGDDKTEILVQFSRQQATFGSIAVQLFFFLSGMLITSSWLNSRSMNDYLRRRILRICPGYAVALVCSAVMASFFAADHARNLLSKAWIRTFLHDLLFLDFSSMEAKWIFPSNPFPNAANGSLWTINLEFACYLLVSAIGLFWLFKRRFLLLALFGFLLARNTPHSGVTWHLLTAFVGGMNAWLWRDKIPLNGAIFSGCAVFLLFVCKLPPLFTVLFPFFGSYAILWLGLAFPARWLAWCDRTDLSYGVYLFAFPVQQMIAALFPWRSPGLMFGLALPLTLGCAFLSWTFVERPFLRLKRIESADYDPAQGAFRPATKDIAPGTASPVLTSVVG